MKSSKWYDHARSRATAVYGFIVHVSVYFPLRNCWRAGLPLEVIVIAVAVPVPAILFFWPL